MLANTLWENKFPLIVMDVFLWHQGLLITRFAHIEIKHITPQ